MTDTTTLRGALGATILLPGDADYDAVLPHYAGAGDPAAIVRPTTPEQVADALRVARERGLAVSVRSGGHAAKVFPNPDGLVIDMAAFDAIEVRPDGTVRVGAGATWGAVAEALTPHGLVITSGDTRDVGVGGLALGGGMGWLVRAVGLTIDIIDEIELVTVDGRQLTASADSEPELFWALRGGGGNFGVVTHFTFRPTALDAVVGGRIQLALDDLPAVLTAWRDVMRAAPDELSATFLALPAMGPDAAPSAQLIVCYAGDDEAAGLAAIAPLLELPGVTDHDIARRPYLDLVDEAMTPPPVRMVGGNGMVDLDDDTLAQFAASVTGFAAPTIASVRYLGGAFARVPADATAFAVRDLEAMLFRVVLLPPDAPDELAAAAAEPFAPVRARITSTYGNFAEAADPALLPLLYPPATLERLRAVKRAYDPDNVLRRNHNIM
ncbi:FAD-binding oxidoreductase [Protaetiibacter mangrovi]|uniref:FAD-binding oxidoreductase n=1 Tax=Protaetiibacter mangrovi TaxID=2970926 RepID=A0ABT1ZHS3_9MICO|nr:FAD-binding oxidoreductase [Protaetiibacter mangrovi]MCS0500257.1 FAD-binding oxidoreductase [Protaetiibacter mangrovi]TPX03363.1 FAD-binding oxidoreductase [Schumannella luteola]